MAKAPSHETPGHRDAVRVVTLSPSDQTTDYPDGIAMIPLAISAMDI
jgi:hypothetical protein